MGTPFKMKGFSGFGSGASKALESLNKAAKTLVIGGKKGMKKEKKDLQISPPYKRPIGPRAN